MPEERRHQQSGMCLQGHRPGTGPGPTDVGGRGHDAHVSGRRGRVMGVDDHRQRQPCPRHSGQNGGQPEAVPGLCRLGAAAVDVLAADRIGSIGIAGIGRNSAFVAIDKGYHVIVGIILGFIAPLGLLIVTLMPNRK